MFIFQKYSINLVRAFFYIIIITDEFLRTRNSFCSYEAICSMLNLAEREKVFFHDPAKLYSGHEMNRTFQGDFASSIHMSFSLMLVE